MPPLPLLVHILLSFLALFKAWPLLGTLFNSASLCRSLPSLNPVVLDRLTLFSIELFFKLPDKKDNHSEVCHVD